MNTKKEPIGEFQYHTVTFEAIIKWFIQNCLKKDDWETLAIDPHKRIVVLKRFEMPKKEDTTEEKEE